MPTKHLCGALSDVCVPLAGRCIYRLQLGNEDNVERTDMIMIEFELSIGLIFKPLRHHLAKMVEAESNLFAIWKNILRVIEDLLCGDRNDDQTEMRDALPPKLKMTMNDLANEHLQNAIMVLISNKVLGLEAKSKGDMTSMTWDAVKRMGFSEEWIKTASTS